MNVTKTKPFSTATPVNAMNLTAAEMENGSPRNHTCQALLERESLKREHRFLLYSRNTSCHSTFSW
jgi:hypothetical protein